MSEVLTEIDDPVTATLMEGVNEARILLASEAHRKDLAEMAKISREMILMQERYVELQVSIAARNVVYQKAEEELHGHLATKHRVTPASFGVREPQVDPEPSRSTRREVEDQVPELSMRRRADAAVHAANCAVGFGDPCDCQ